MKQVINVKGGNISLYSKNQDDFISLTDIAKFKNLEFPRYVVQNWMRTRFTIEFIWLWEQINNKDFNRVEFDTFKNESWANSFILNPKQWIEKTNAIWIISTSGRYGWTYAHKDIAFEFASWISVEFKLYLIKEFQRLKEKESKSLEWSVKRELTKINYKLQTDSIKNYLIPSLKDFKKKYVYSDEADLLNIIIFWKTAKDWKLENKDKSINENIRDYATIEQLLLLANLENLNWEFIKQWLDKYKRYELLSEITTNKMKILFDNNNFKNLK